MSAQLGFLFDAPAPAPGKLSPEGATRRLDDLGSVQDGRKMSSDGQGTDDGASAAAGAADMRESAGIAPVANPATIVGASSLHFLDDIAAAALANRAMLVPWFLIDDGRSVDFLGALFEGVDVLQRAFDQIAECGERLARLERGPPRHVGCGRGKTLLGGGSDPLALDALGDGADAPLVDAEPSGDVVLLVAAIQHSLHDGDFVVVERHGPSLVAVAKREYAIAAGACQ